MNKFLSRYKDWGFEQSSIELPKTLRINTCLIKPEELVKRLEKKGAKLTKIPYLVNGYKASASFSLGSTPEYLMGYYYLQEAAAQIPVQVLAPKENEIIIDTCAAPGGKTTQISCAMNNTGTVLALDNHSKRIQSLENNVERMRSQNIMTLLKDASHMQDLDIQADRILVDAPCSGNFVTDTDWFKKRNINQFKEKQKVQQDILRSAAQVLKKNGILVYATCSLEKEENEEVVEWALQSLPLRLEPIELMTGSPGLTDTTKNCIRMWPSLHGTQGFFVAKFSKV